MKIILDQRWMSISVKEHEGVPLRHVVCRHVPSVPRREGIPNHATRDGPCSSLNQISFVTFDF